MSLNAEMCTCHQNLRVATKSRCLGWNVHVQTYFRALFQPKNKSEQISLHVWTLEQWQKVPQVRTQMEQWEKVQTQALAQCLRLDTHVGPSWIGQRM